MREIKYEYKILVGILRRKHHLLDLVVDGKMLKLMLHRMHGSGLDLYGPGYRLVNRINFGLHITQENS